jgi:hypothetical protein
MDGYKDTDSSLTISGSPVTEDVTLKEVITSIKPAVDKNVNIYPNPSDGLFHIKVENTGGFAAIYRLTGELLMKKQLNQNAVHFNISNQPDGIYLIEISSENGSFTKKLLKK